MRITQYCSASALLAAAAFAQPADTAAEARWFSNVRQLTTAEMGLVKAGEAYFSPDGKRVCFQAYPKGESEYQIYVINVDGTGVKMISTGKGATTCSYFSPDGAKLQFASNHLDPRPVPTPEEVKTAAEKAGVRNYQWSFFPGMDIFEFDFASSETKRIVDTPGYDAEGSYSPDGKKIVFTSYRDGDLEIYIADADGKNARRITRAKGYDGGPFFSPDGKHVIYRSDRYDNGNLQIFINNLEGTAERALTDDKNVLHWCPFWHPSGKWLIFTRAVHSENARPNYDLYLLPVDVNAKEAKLADPIRVTNDPTFDGLPVFSADGRKLMWTSKRGGIEGAQVFIADFHGLSPSGMLTTETPK
ncbi:MAG: PD40 domain-containing protein [Phycisphaerales bacterium]|nr:PD40 domain-containing protein [Phycisphaerales bacterium]